MTARAAVQVADLNKSYGSHRAVRDVSFRVESGGSLGIVGESGSGKTTLARMIVGLESPDSGRIVVAGRERTRSAARRAERLTRAREVQMVFQDPYLSLDPRIRVEKAVDEVVRLHDGGPSRTRAERVTELLEQVGLGRREAAALPSELSGGQRQRVAIARALAARPRTLVLDEAVSALDVSIQAQILVLLDRIRAEYAMTFLFVSHDLAVVRSVTDDVLVLRQGEVVEEGPTERVLAEPRHPYTELLLASVPRQGWDLAAISAARKRLAAGGRRTAEAGVFGEESHASA